MLIVNKDWTNEEERLTFVSTILQHYPSLSAQLDRNGQLAFHDYSALLSSSPSSSLYSFDDIVQSIQMKNNPKEYFIEKRTMKSGLIDKTDYEQLLMLLESTNIRRIFNILRRAHARLFSGYPCASLTLPVIHLSRKQKRLYQKRDKYDKQHSHLISPPHLCSLIFISRQPCMCLTDSSCFCHYTLTLTTYIPSSRT